MNKNFSAKKRQVLEQLSKDHQEYTDASPKGSVDEGIRDLVQAINSTSGYVTTSSCAGRVAVFLEGATKPYVAPHNGDPMARTSKFRDMGTSSAGGKGGGRWLFVSHEPVAIGCHSEPGALLELLDLRADSSSSIPQLEEAPQFVHFKFEPMILHILTAGVEQAQAALTAAMTAGFRESGISGIVDGKGGPATPMLAVRSSGLAFDSIIGFKSATDDAPIRLVVSESYLRTLVKLTDERFRVNAERKERFRQAFLQQVKSMRGKRPATDGQVYEPVDVRRERKRREGLERRAGMHDSNRASDRQCERSDADDDDVCVDLLMNEAEAT